jgi:hypothetical protein
VRGDWVSLINGLLEVVPPIAIAGAFVHSVRPRRPRKSSARCRGLGTGRAERTGARCLAACDQAGRARAAPPAASTKRPLSGDLLPVQPSRSCGSKCGTPMAARAPDSAIRRPHTPVCAIDSRPPPLHLRLTAGSGRRRVSTIPGGQALLGAPGPRRERHTTHTSAQAPENPLTHIWYPALRRAYRVSGVASPSVV